MSNHYVAINRGKDGFKISDFTFGTSSSSSSDVEIRIADLDGQSVAMTRKDVLIALEAFERYLANGGMFSTFPKL